MELLCIVTLDLKLSGKYIRINTYRIHMVYTGTIDGYFYCYVIIIYELV